MDIIYTGSESNHYVFIDGYNQVMARFPKILLDKFRTDVIIKNTKSYVRKHALIAIH